MEQFEERESSPRTFEQAVEEGKKIALETIFHRYVQTDPRHKLEGHNVEHTANVMARTKAILEALRAVDSEVVTERMIQLAELAASHHDIYMEDEIVPVQDGMYTRQLRKRQSGVSEQKSADELRAYMDLPQNKGLFTDEEKNMLTDAILHTVPTYSPEHKTVVQERLKEHSSIIARALALADLADAGMGGYEAYKKQGDGFFREENYDITYALFQKPDITSGEALNFKERMVAWSRMQIGFAEGRKKRFEDEISGISEEGKTALRNIFSHFDDSIERAKQTTEARMYMTFKEVAQDMGYDVSHLP